MKINWRRVYVSLANAVEIPLAVYGAYNIEKNFSLAIVCVIAAAICAYIYTSTKPYWANGNGSK